VRSEALKSKPQRILLKLSGELLAGEAGHGIDERIEPIPVVGLERVAIEM